MRKLKRFASVLLALVMCFGLTVTAFADDSYTITITNSTEGYTYAAYQVFAGTLADGKLSGITWGSGVNSDDLVAALKAASDETDNTLEGMFPKTSYTAEEVAEVLSGDDFTEAMVVAFAEIVGDNLSSTYTASDTFTTGDAAYTISGLAAGYYLVKNTAVPTDGVYTSYILEVVANVDADPKTEVPTFTKTIDDINDSTTTTYTTSDTDSADYDINDPAHYTLTATLPSNYAEYDTYQLVFHDIMDSGLSFNADSVKITVTNGSTTYEVASGYTLYTADTTDTYDATSDYEGHTTSDDSTFEIKIADTNNLKTANDTTIPVDKDSIITVTYTATLTSGAGYAEWNYAYLEYSNNPTWDGTGTETTSNTPEEEVVAITLKLVVNKTKSDNTTALEGATFKLSKYDAGTSTWKEVSTIVGTSQSTFTWDGLDDGWYKLEETNPPDGYKAIDTIYFTVAATHDETITDSESKANTLTTESEQYANVLKSLTVKQTDENGAELTGSNITLSTTITLSSGEIATTVANSMVAELPSTGGIGTTIFYVVGGVLVVGAVVLLITRKRMQGDQ